MSLYCHYFQCLCFLLIKKKKSAVSIVNGRQMLLMYFILKGPLLKIHHNLNSEHE